MADATVTALRPAVKDRTAAERSRRYRRKRKSKVREVPAPLPEPVTPVTPHDGRGVTVCTTVAALATVSAGFSITGMTAVFVGATLPAVGRGVALELGKLSAVACLGRRYGSAPLRAALVALVAVLMGLNAIGAYGFLARAHIGHATEGDVAVAGRAADIDSRLTVQAGVVSDLDRRIAQIDGAVASSARVFRCWSASAIADPVRPFRVAVSRRVGMPRGGRHRILPTRRFCGLAWNRRTQRSMPRG